MAWKLYFHAAVKYNSAIPITLKHALRCALQVMCIVLVAAGAAPAGDIVVGSSGNTTRIVFHLKSGEAMSPDLVEQNQTLIVNFPHTVAEPQTMEDLFLIDHLAFDGTRATITMKHPFTYTSSFKQLPARLVVDISMKRQEGQEHTCPVRRFDMIPGTSRSSVVMVLDEGTPVDVRTAGKGRVFVHFPAEISCTDLGRLLEGIPQLTSVNLMKMASGTTLIMSVNKHYTMNRAKVERDGTRVIFEMSASGDVSPQTRGSSAQSLFDAGNSAAVIRMLEPHISSLSDEEAIILARSYWSLAFPYRMGERSNASLSLMSRAIQELPEGPRRDRVMLEHCSMLIRAGLPSEAGASLSRLRNSENDDVRAEASIREMDVLNRGGSYQDAYAAGRRLVIALGAQGLPERLKPLYSAVLADTYLGLNDHAKALDLYRQALSSDPDYPRTDPGIYARMGDAAFRMNDFSRAKDYLTLALNLAGGRDRQKYLLMLGDSLYQTGEKDRAIVVFSQAENLVPEGDGLAIAKLKTARIIIEKNTDERGRLSDRAFNEVMDIYQTLKTSAELKDKALASLVKVRIAQAYAKHGDWEKALATYHEVWRNTKKGDTIHHYTQVEAIRGIVERTRVLYRDSRYDQIYEIYTRYRGSFIKELRDSATLFVIGDALNRLGQTEEARTMLELSTRGDSIYKEQAFSLLFTIDIKRNKFQEALIWNTIYLSTYPDGKDARIMRERRGEVLYRLGSLSAALPHLEASAAEGGPLALHSLSYLADAYRRLGTPLKEEEALDRIIAFHPERVSPIIEEALYKRAGQLRKAASLARASSLYQALLDAYPRSSHVHWAMYYLAGIAHVQGDASRARELLTNIMRLSKDPVLVSAARVTSDEMALIGDLDGYEATKQHGGR